MGNCSWAATVAEAAQHRIQSIYQSMPLVENQHACEGAPIRSIFGDDIVNIESGYSTIVPPGWNKIIFFSPADNHRCSTHCTRNAPSWDSVTPAELSRRSCGKNHIKRHKKPITVWSTLLLHCLKTTLQIDYQLGVLITPSNSWVDGDAQRTNHQQPPTQSDLSCGRYHIVKVVTHLKRPRGYETSIWTGDI